MERKEYFKKIRQMIEKLDKISGFEMTSELAVVDDPDFDSDIGADSDDNLVISGRSTHLSIRDITEIKHYYQKFEFYDDYSEISVYIALYFKNNMKVEINLSNGQDPLYGAALIEYLHINHNSSLYMGLAAKDIILTMQYDEEIVISDDTLLAYFGKEKTFCVPEGITKISNSAFAFNKYVKNVKLADTTNEIGEYAFFHSVLTNIDLNNVEKICDSAFASCELEKITLPETLVYAGKSIFDGCGLHNKENRIENRSSIELVLD